MRLTEDRANLERQRDKQVETVPILEHKGHGFAREQVTVLIQENEKGREKEPVIEQERKGGNGSSKQESSPSVESDFNHFADLTLSLEGEKGRQEAKVQERMKESFAKVINNLKKMKPLTQTKVREWLEQFFRLVEKLKRKEVAKEEIERQVSLKLGLMTGQKELVCDFCEVHDHFYPGAIFADVYVDGRLQWIMCPNCLLYCKEQANGDLEQNIRARFHYLAYRLEQATRRARRLAIAEEFRVPSTHEWEAWETASYALQEVASTEQRWERGSQS